MCLCGHADELHNQFGQCTVSGCECAGDMVSNVPPIETEITVTGIAFDDYYFS